MFDNIFVLAVVSLAMVDLDVVVFADFLGTVKAEILVIVFIIANVDVDIFISFVFNISFDVGSLSLIDGDFMDKVVFSGFGGGNLVDVDVDVGCGIGSSRVRVGGVGWRGVGGSAED